MPLHIRKLPRILIATGAIPIRQKGSHQIWRLENCTATVPVHTREIPDGTLRSIQKQLAPCIGQNDWLLGRK